MIHSTPIARADALLADQHAKLSAVIDGDAPSELKHMARRYLADVLHWQARRPAVRDLALGEMGPNGKAPAIDDVCAQARFHAARAQQSKRKAA